MNNTEQSQLSALFEPHHGPDIVDTQISEHSAILTLYVPKTIAWFKGHFPDQPVLPGVVQIDWAIKVAKAVFSSQVAPFSQITNLKFKSVVLPETEVRLELTLDPIKNSVAFHFVNPEESFSTGTIKFKHS